MYKMGEINREMLLGYLMNALEDDEISHVERELLRRPKLRAELAELQQELSPLSFVYESVDPPPNLARRTCDKIWALADREERMGRSIDGITEKGPVISLSLPIPDIAAPPAGQRTPDHSEAVEELLAASPHLPESAPKRLVRRAEKKSRRSFFSKTAPPSETESSRPMKRSGRGRWIDVLASVGVGILIALVVFPAINFTKNRAQTYFTRNKLKEINQSVERYTQIQGGVVAQAAAAEPSNQLNLANYGWQEIKPDRIPLLVVNNDTGTVDPQLDIAAPNPPEHLTPVYDALASVDSREHGTILGQSRPDTFLGPTVGLDNPGDISNQTLFSNVGLLPVANGATLQTAYGQNLLFHNGKIFVRRIPVAQPSE